jgi:hypothetical protein
MSAEDRISIERNIDVDKLGWPAESSLAAEDYFNRGYNDLRGLTWEDARQTLELEKEIIARYPGDLANAEESMYEEEYGISDLYSLDRKLNRAGVFPFHMTKRTWAS